MRTQMGTGGEPTPKNFTPYDYSGRVTAPRWQDEHGEGISVYPRTDGATGVCLTASSESREAISVRLYPGQWRRLVEAGEAVVAANPPATPVGQGPETEMERRRRLDSEFLTARATEHVSGAVLDSRFLAAAGFVALSEAEAKALRIDDGDLAVRHFGSGEVFVVGVEVRCRPVVAAADRGGHEHD